MIQTDVRHRLSSPLGFGVSCGEPKLFSREAIHGTSASSVPPVRLVDYKNTPSGGLQKISNMSRWEDFVRRATRSICRLPLLYDTKV